MLVGDTAGQWFYRFGIHGVRMISISSHSRPSNSGIVGYTAADFYLQYLQMHAVRHILKILLIAAMAGCAISDYDRTENWSARKIYNEAKISLSGGDFEQAVEYFEILESRYPFGRYTLQAQLDIAYAHYKRREFDSAIDSANRFIRLHPRNPHIDYAYYLKGLVNFSRGSGLLSNYIGRELSNQDQQALVNSFADFDTLIRRFPTSLYVEDARRRMVFLRNEMAEHELKVAKFLFWTRRDAGDHQQGQVYDRSIRRRTRNSRRPGVNGRGVSQYGIGRPRR